MAKRQTYQNKLSPTLKWGVGLLLFVFFFSSVIVYCNNVSSFAKQQIYDEKEEEATFWEENAEKDGIDFSYQLDYFFSKVSCIKIWAKTHFEKIISFCKCPNPPFQNIPLFIKNRVLRL